MSIISETCCCKRVVVFGKVMVWLDIGSMVVARLRHLCLFVCVRGSTLCMRVLSTIYNRSDWLFILSNRLQNYYLTIIAKIIQQ